MMAPFDGSSGGSPILQVPDQKESGHSQGNDQQQQGEDGKTVTILRANTALHGKPPVSAA